MTQKEQQEKLLNDLNNTIKELEELSKGLQDDVQEKQNQINVLDEEKLAL